MQNPPAPFHATPPVDEGALRAALWETAGDIVIVLAADGRLSAISDRGLAFLGRTREEALGRDWFELALPEADRDNGREVLAGILAGRLSARGRSHAWDILAASGRRRMCWSHALFASAASGPAAVLGCGHDITDQIQGEEALRESDVAHRSIFNAANDAIFIHDAATGAVLEANDRAVDLFGYTPEEFRRLAPLDLSSGHSPHDDAAIQTKIRLARTGLPQLFEWLARDKSGRYFWTEINLRAVAYKGHTRVIAVVRDISERRRAEQALRESEEKFRQLAEAIGEVFWLLSLIHI